MTDNSASGAISLSVIESSPLVSGVIAFPVVAYQSKSMLRDHLRTPAGVIHLMFGIYVLILILFYIARLPGHAQITVRYLTPIYPILIYVTARLAHTESILTGNLQTFLWTYSGIVLLGTQSAFAFLMIIDAQVGEAMQFLALVGISAAVPLAIYTITRTIFPGQLPDRLGSVVLALATGSGTVLLLITGLHLFAFTENYALPIVRLLVTLLP